MGARRETLSGAERSQLWERWRAGDSVAEIARGLSRTYHPVYSHVSRHGGIEPRRRHRREEHLSLQEREEISRGLAAGASLRAIALRLGRSPSTVSREVARSGGRERYRAGGLAQDWWHVPVGTPGGST
jgi:IS30 family transposase